MVKSKKSIALTVLLTTAVLLLSCMCCFINNNTTNAATKGDPSDVSQPYGLVTQISLSVGATSENVWAKARNVFTLGNSTVQVYVCLYSSLDYQDDCSKMTLEGSAYIYDLNINESLETLAAINGVQRYWRARVEFKLDKNDWKSKESETYLIDANGNLVR